MTRVTRSGSPERSKPSSRPFSSIDARPGHVGDQQPHVVADADRVHVLVEVRVDLDRARVQPGLVGERRRADVRLPAGGRDVGDVGDRVRDPGRVARAARRAAPSGPA